MANAVVRRHYIGMHSASRAERSVCVTHLSAQSNFTAARGP